MALYPLYGGVLHIIDVGLSILVGLLAVIVHLCLIYIGRIYFHLGNHYILSCVLNTLYKEVPPLKRISIYIYYSLLSCVLLSSGLFLLFLCYLWDLFWLHKKEEGRVLAQLEEREKQEEILWKHKSSVDWLMEGERITNFFH